MSLKGLLIPLCIVLCVALVVATLFVAGAFDRNSVPSQDDPVLVGAGDIADGVSDNDEATAALIRGIPSTVFTVRDNAYGSPSEAPFEIYYDPTWGTEKDRTKPTPGNHEYKYGRTAGGDGAKDYFDYFGEVAAEDNGGFYSYELGDWHVIALNTGQCYGAPEPDGSRPRCRPRDPMLAWLESDLQANQKRCTLAYFHRPLFSSGGPLQGNPGQARAIWDLLYSHDADLVVNGHEHQYERFAPQDPEGVADSARGIREFVVGTGGRQLNEFKTTAANSEARNSDTTMLSSSPFTGAATTGSSCRSLARPSPILAAKAVTNEAQTHPASASFRNDPSYSSLRLFS